MAEKDEKKVKGFRISSGLHSVIDNLISDSGKDPGEWFEDLIQQVASNELVLEKSGVPADLRKHFGSDLAAIKDATNLIQSLFINQMNRISVERINWNSFLQTKVNEYDEKMAKLKIEISSLEQSLQQKDGELESGQTTIQQLLTKVEGFDKLEAQLRKDIERLEGDSLKASHEIQRIREEFLSEKQKYFKDLDELKGNHKQEKDRLNQQIVDLVNQLKKVEPLSEENRKLKDEIKELNTVLNQNTAEFELKLTRAKEQAELDKEKALLVKERELRALQYAQSREDMKELYEKIEKLQAENNQLRVEKSNFKDTRNED